MMLELIAIKVVLFTCVLYALSVVFRGWVKFRGLTPLLTTTFFLVPINVFIVELTELAGFPPRPAYLLGAAVVCNGVVLYVLSLSINSFRLENFRAALLFALILGAFSLYLNLSLAQRIAGLI